MHWSSSSPGRSGPDRPSDGTQSHDDEIGMLVRSYNRNQQSLVRQHDELSIQSTRFPVSELPNKACWRCWSRRCSPGRAPR